MKKEIKRCKGFTDANCCLTCKRLDKNAQLLVTGLAIDPDSGRKYCNYHLYEKR